MKKAAIVKPVYRGVARVPVVMQLEALECGAASLAMVLAYYKKWLPLEKVRADCGVSRNGSNARNILKAARSYGLRANGYRFEPDALREQGSFPCIIHWDFNHFVVLDGFRGKKAYINDPAKGNYSVTMQEFDKAFTGICLLFEPTDEFESGGKQKSTLAFARSRLVGAGASAAFVFVVLETVFSSLLDIIKPGFSRVFLDRLLTGYNPSWLYPFIIGLSILCMLELVINCVMIHMSYRIDGKLATYGTTSYLWKVFHLPMEFFSQRMAGDIQSRQAANASISTTLIDILAPLFLNTIMMLFYLVVMLRYSVLLTTVGLASIALQALMAQLIAKKRTNITRVVMRDEGKLVGATVAGIEMIETIKASGAENGLFEKWSGYQASVNTQRVKDIKLQWYPGLIPSLISELSALTILGLGVFLTMQNMFSIGMIMAFQGLMGSFTEPASSLISAGQSIQEMRADMERIEDVMQYPSDEYAEREGSSEEYKKLSGKIEIHNLSFGYSRLDEPLIQGFDLSVKPGQSVALVGSSGCGKSTLSKLISGLYQPWSGEICFDGKPMSSIDRNVFTGSLAVVDQDIILFEDTIANNIKMWDNTIEDFEMILAARDAQLHDDIMQRDGGYQYKLTEGGKDFSGGQRQRMEIARVLAQDPTIAILDEATSALDAVTECNVVKAIRDRGITCIVVAHRLSTIRDCDEIIVLEHGRVVERGTHDELYAMGGLYTELVTNE